MEQTELLPQTGYMCVYIFQCVSSFEVYSSTVTSDLNIAEPSYFLLLLLSVRRTPFDLDTIDDY